MTVPKRHEKVKEGDEISAKAWNRITRAQEQLGALGGSGIGQQISGSGVQTTIPRPPAFRLVELDVDVGPEAGADFRLRQATELVYDQSSAATDDPANKWVRSSRTLNVANYWKMPFDDNQRLVVFSAGPNMWIPLPFMQIRHAITVSDSGAYPDEASAPDTYPISFIDAEFTESAGQNGETFSEKPAGPHAFVHNWWDGPNSYLHEGTVIFTWCMPKLNTPGEVQWWTLFCCEGSEFSSESSISISESSASSTSQHSSSSTSLNSSSSASSSSSSVFGHCELYGPTMTTVGENLRMPIFELHIENGVLECEEKGFDEVDICTPCVTGP